MSDYNNPQWKGPAKAVPFSVSIGTTGAVLLGPSTARRAIQVSAPTVGRISLMAGQIPTLGSGITLSAGDPPLLLSSRHWYCCVNEPWYAISEVASINVVGQTVEGS